MDNEDKQTLFLLLSTSCVEIRGDQHFTLDAARSERVNSRGGMGAGGREGVKVVSGRMSVKAAVRLHPMLLLKWLCVHGSFGLQRDRLPEACTTPLMPTCLPCTLMLFFHFFHFFL